MAAPTTYSPLQRFLGLAKDVTPGTPVAPVADLPIDKFDWKPVITALEDKALRGSMSDDVYNLIQGVKRGEIDMGGPVFGDELGYLLGNIFGADDVTGTAAPFSHKFSLLNSGTGQSGTLSLTQRYGPEATHQARVFSGCAFTEVGFSFNAESELLKYTAKALSWDSQVATATPTATFTATKPLPSWQAVLGVNGPASGGSQVLNVASGEFNFKRKVKPYYTAQNSQNPFVMQRGVFSADFKLKFVADGESPLTNLENNSQYQHQFILSNGLAGANLVSIQIDIQQGAYTEANPNFGSEAIEWDVVGRCVLNTTNVGASGGYGPATVTLQNAIASGTFV
jgi:hypothetical protein